MDTKTSSCKLSRFDIIVAINIDNGIGKNGTIPWKHKQDFAHFKSTTIGTGDNAIIMGRKTYQSLPKSWRPLPGRRNIVVSSTDIQGVETVRSLADALHLSTSNRKTFIAGGVAIYHEAMQKYAYLCDKILISHIPDTQTCDVFFPYDLAKSIALYSKRQMFEYFEDLEVLKDQSEGLSVKKKIGELVLETITVDKTHPEQQYLDILTKILDKGEKRPDRTGVGVKSIFGLRMQFDLRDGAPFTTTKRLPVKCVEAEELFFISGKTDTKILEAQNVNIWKKNTSEQYLTDHHLPWVEGDMGPSYGLQWRHAGAEYTGCKTDYTGKGVDQLKNVIEGIKKDPFGRRHVVSAWDAANIHLMVLPPCHAFFQFYVGCDEAGDPTYLDCNLYQRSSDMFLGIPFNIASYTLLMHMIGHITGLIPRKFIHDLGDAHIYLNHMEQVRELVTRTPYPLCKISFARSITDIDDFKIEDIIITGYRSWSIITGDMAV